MKVKHTLKKQKFLTERFLIEKFNYLFRRAKGVLIKVDLSTVSPLDVGSLPFPVRWNSFYPYDQLIVEIGTGHGELMEHLSESQKTLVVGFEITKTYTLKTSKGLKEKKNALVFKGDGYYYTLNLFEDNSIDKIFILFPDPWHKKKHHKRRPIKKDWLVKVRNKLKTGGSIYFATDWMEYYQFVEGQISSLKNVDSSFKIEKGKYIPEGAGLVSTHYYEKWLEEGREFNYIQLTKSDHSAT